MCPPCDLFSSFLNFLWAHAHFITQCTDIQSTFVEQTAPDLAFVRVETGVSMKGFRCFQPAGQGEQLLEFTSVPQHGCSPGTVALSPFPKGLLF